MRFSLKSFILGLGCGIVAMSLVFYCVYSVKYKQTEKTLAQQNNITDAVEEETPETSIWATPAPSDTVKPTALEPVAEQLELEAQAEGQQSGAEATTDTAEITIRFGAGAREIAQQLLEAGVITDEDAFINYLISQQATKRLRTGTFTFYKDTSFEAIGSEIIFD